MASSSGCRARCGARAHHAGRAVGVRLAQAGFIEPKWLRPHALPPVCFWSLLTPFVRLAFPPSPSSLRPPRPTFLLPHAFGHPRTRPPTRSSAHQPTCNVPAVDYHARIKAHLVKNTSFGKHVSHDPLRSCEVFFTERGIFYRMSLELPNEAFFADPMMLKPRFAEKGIKYRKRFFFCRFGCYR